MAAHGFGSGKNHIDSDLYRYAPWRTGTDEDGERQPERKLHDWRKQNGGRYQPDHSNREMYSALCAALLFHQPVRTLALPAHAG